MTNSSWHRLKARVDRLGDEVATLAYAARDPRTPWYAKAVVVGVVGLALSPIDPIPDFVPVLGYLDDLVFVPAGVLLARKLVPEAVLRDARDRAAEAEGGRARWIAAALIVVAWLLLAALALRALAG